MADCNSGIYRIAVEDEQVACGFERATGMMFTGLLTLGRAHTLPGSHFSR